MEINTDNMKLLITEIGIMKTSHHENIVDYIDSYIVDERHLWVVMEVKKRIYFKKINKFSKVYGWWMFD